MEILKKKYVKNGLSTLLFKPMNAQITLLMLSVSFFVVVVETVSTCRRGTNEHKYYTIEYNDCIGGPEGFSDNRALLKHFK